MSVAARSGFGVLHMFGLDRHSGGVRIGVAAGTDGADDVAVRTCGDDAPPSLKVVVLPSTEPICAPLRRIR